MADKLWRGGADAVAQTATVQITAYDASTTYTITIGGVAVSAAGTTDVDGTAAALGTALGAKKTAGHPYFAALSYGVTTDTITISAETAGVPFVATSSVTGGTGTIGSVTETVANAGPCVFDTGENWADGSAPASSDSVYFAQSAVNCCYGLDQSALTGLTLYVDQSYTGKLGLDSAAFATSADGATLDSSIREYRQSYLKADCSAIEIGRNPTSQTFTGSSRIKVENSRSSSSTCAVFQTGTSSGPPCVLLLASHANADIEIRAAEGGVGIAVDDPTETATVGDIEVSGATAGTLVSIGSGVTMTNLKVNEGEVTARAAATVTAVTLNGGQIDMEGTATITTLNVNGGTFLHNGPFNITTANIDGGAYDASNSNGARTVTTLNFTSGEFSGDAELTVTTFNEPSTGRLAWSES